jgi:DNA-binding GntR family transcriptional regulator
MTTNADYERLRTAIITGELGPNTRLIETDVCAAYGMSRGAVRNALIRLEQEGLVVREPNRGARVRQVSDQEAGEILSARAVLEGLVARQAAETIDPAGSARLQEILDRHGAAVEAGDLLGASEANAQLHAAILEISGNATFERLITALNSQTVRYQFRTILTPGRPFESHQEHAAIVAAITNGEPDEAERAMRHHLFSVAEVVRRLSPAARANGAPVVI